MSNVSEKQNSRGLAQLVHLCSSLVKSFRFLKLWKEIQSWFCGCYKGYFEVSIQERKYINNTY